MTQFKPEDEFVKISLGEYLNLLNYKKELMALHHHGVDNWEYYDDALNDAYPED